MLHYASPLSFCGREATLLSQGLCEDAKQLSHNFVCRTSNIPTLFTGKRNSVLHSGVVAPRDGEREHFPRNSIGCTAFTGYRTRCSKNSVNGSGEDPAHTMRNVENGRQKTHRKLEFTRGWNKKERTENNAKHLKTATGQDALETQSLNSSAQGSWAINTQLHNLAGGQATKIEFYFTMERSFPSLPPLLSQTHKQKN